MNEELYTELFGYDKKKYTKIPKNVFKIRPSSVSTFFDMPVVWYKEFVLKQGKSFKGNTGSVLGNVLHKCYEYAFTDVEIPHQDLIECVVEYNIKEPGLFDKNEVLTLYPLMLEGMLETYINPIKEKHDDIHVEEEVMWEISPGYVLRGLIDLSYSSIIADYKDVSKKPSNLDTIPFNYKIQQLAYAEAKNRKGGNIDRIELVYNVRPTKTLPARQYTVREAITQQDRKMCIDTIELIAESVEAVKKQPELTHLIFKSMNLKTQGNNNASKVNNLWFK